MHKLHFLQSNVENRIDSILLYTALLYTHDGSEKNEATEAEVADWLTRLRMKEERRALVTDDYISRGWEAPAVMVIGISGTENLVMRTCGFCFLIKVE